MRDNPRHAKISAIQTDLTSAGPGIRTEIFFHGCSRGCPGCINEWTKDYPYRQISAIGVAREIRNLGNTHVSISGGEPMEQIPALQWLLARRWDFTYPHGDILVYTGWTMEEVMQSAAYYTFRNNVDYVVTDPFVQELAYEKLEDSFVGSSNQRFWIRNRGVYRQRDTWEEEWILTPLDNYGRWQPSE